MSTIKKWYGDDRDDENSKDFLRAVQRDMRDLKSNPAEQVKEVGLYLAGGGPADLWFEKLPKKKMATWELFEATFLTEFLVVKAVEKMKEQYEEELLDLKLKEEELGKSVEKGSMQVPAVEAWANKVLHLAKLCKVANGTSMLSQVWKNLPEVLRQKLADSYPDYTSFCQAVHKINPMYIKKSAEKLKRKQEEKKRNEEELVKLKKELVNLTKLQVSPTRGIRNQLTSMSF
jgi:hypothetical protein